MEKPKSKEEAIRLFESTFTNCNDDDDWDCGDTCPLCLFFEGNCELCLEAYNRLKN